MITGTGTYGEDKLLVIGLTRDNAERLLKGQPIRVDGAKVGIPGVQVLILGGETEEGIALDLAGIGAVGPHTEIHDRR